MMLRTTRSAAACARLPAHLLMLALLSGSMIPVAQAAGQDFASCRAITDNAARLRCFDALDRAPASAPPAPVAPAAVAPPIAPPAVTEVAPMPSAPPRPAPPVAAAPAAPAPVDNFGAVAIPRAAPQEPKEITAQAIVNVDGVYRGLIFPLDNGQTWTVIDDREFEYFGSNPRVKLDRNLIGSYWMRILDGGPRFRVRRLK